MISNKSQKKRIVAYSLLIALPSGLVNPSQASAHEFAIAAKISLSNSAKSSIH